MLLSIVCGWIIAMGEKNQVPFTWLTWTGLAPPQSISSPTPSIGENRPLYCWGLREIHSQYCTERGGCGFRCTSSQKTQCSINISVTVLLYLFYSMKWPRLSSTFLVEITLLNHTRWWRFVYKLTAYSSRCTLHKARWDSVTSCTTFKMTFWSRTEQDKGLSAWHRETNCHVIGLQQHA